MQTNETYTLLIGLLKKDMKTALNIETVQSQVVQQLLNKNILGCNIELIKGMWNGAIEPALKVSFINTFNATNNDIETIANNLKQELEQESVLIQKGSTQYSFI